tara:strand:+ start:19787 stop:20410 length:624 start_codon:yes stop_codon:yes gene_type:complete
VWGLKLDINEFDPRTWSMLTKSKQSYLGSVAGTVKHGLGTKESIHKQAVKPTNKSAFRVPNLEAVSPPKGMQAKISTHDPRRDPGSFRPYGASSNYLAKSSINSDPETLLANTPSQSTRYVEALRDKDGSWIRGPPESVDTIVGPRKEPCPISRDYRFWSKITTSGDKTTGRGTTGIRKHKTGGREGLRLKPRAQIYFHVGPGGHRI